MKTILFVCLGNICRSPTAKAMFDHKISQAGIEVVTDSAGTIGYHIGSPPDPRAIEFALKWGMDISGQRARKVTLADFRRFDYIFAMDRSNLEDLRAIAPPNATAKLDLVMQLAPEYGLEEVPDPYYGGDHGFERVLDMLEAAADRLIEELKAGR
ncbi:MAG: low molecular weight protein-tyrosine-phosphatase [Wenzhouxiangella sp.]